MNAPQRRRRVLISFFFGEGTIPLGESCARALTELGCDVARFDCRIEHPLQRRLFVPLGRLMRALGQPRRDLARPFGLDNESTRQRALEQQVAALRPDLLFVMRGNHYTREFLLQLKQRYGVRTVAWWLYGPEEQQMLIAEANDYDVYLSMYRTEVPGARVGYLSSLAVDTELYRPDPAGRLSCAHDIAFVGRRNRRRGQIIGELVDLPIRIWGPGWRRPKDGWHPRVWSRVAGNGAWGDALLHIYQHSKIVLDVNVWEPGQANALNLRIFDVPASGGFLLTEYSDRLAEYFRPGVEIETWRDAAELRDKLRFYLANDQAREKIAAAGLQRARAIPSYVDRMREMLEMADAGVT